MTYDQFFEQATGRTPYPYQRALAVADELPEALIAPTGAGKTAAAILGWLYRAAEAVRQATPRRLAFCVPMRTLVSQAAESARTWLSKLDLRSGWKGRWEEVRRDASGSDRGQVADTRELVGWILSLGRGVRIVSPDALRDRVRDEALALWQQ